MIDPAKATLVFSLLDLTDLSDTCGPAQIDVLCRAAVEGLVHAAALCVWPQFVPQAQDRLSGTGVAIATVANFPGGMTDPDRVIDDAVEAMGDGASEIDVVFPWKAFQSGDRQRPLALIEGLRGAMDQGQILKVILETGAFPDHAQLHSACELAIGAGADFLKTSTGKIAQGATPEAVSMMLEVVKTSPRPIGVKVSGGVKSLDQALTYIELARQEMGEAFIAPQTFRIGTSRLHEDLIPLLKTESAPPA